MVKIQEEEINVDRVKEVLKRDDAGAVVLFLGEPRRSYEDGKVISIQYTAYREMAIKEMERIETEAKKKFGLKDVIIIHRLGDVFLKEISFLVGVSSAHRTEAFSGCAWIVDQVKAKVPIWKEIKYESSGDC